MRDGQTRELQRSHAGPQGFLSLYQVILVVVQGGAEGTEFDIANERVTLGRGNDADLKFEDPALSQVHLAFEATSEGMQLRDLQSTNGVRVNGAEVKCAELKHGDRIEAGGHAFQILLEERDPPTRIISFPEA